MSAVSFQLRTLNLNIKPGVKHTIKFNKPYFLTLTVLSWADVFTSIRYKKVIIESLRYCIIQKGLIVYAYCLMTNHLHLIVSCKDPFQLSDTIRDFKRYTAKTILNLIIQEPESRREYFNLIFRVSPKTYSSIHYKFWKSGNHAIEIYSSKFLEQKLTYIHQNPVVKEFVKKPEHWLYSSATNYVKKTSILPEVEVFSLFNN